MTIFGKMFQCCFKTCPTPECHEVQKAKLFISELLQKFAFLIIKQFRDSFHICWCLACQKTHLHCSQKKPLLKGGLSAFLASVSVC